MDFQSIRERFSPFLKQYWLPIIFASLGLIFFVYGLIWISGSGSSSEKDIVFEQSNEATQAQKSSQKILVDIEGAVVRPGVYSLTLDARIQDALVASGGLSGAADRKWVAKNLNLAVKLTDGAKLYIPAKGEVQTSSSVSVKGVTTGTGSSQSSISNQININTASQFELEALPGVGPVTAQKIINGRSYGSVDELLSKKIVSKKVFDQIKERITVY